MGCGSGGLEATGHRFSDKLFIDHGINDFGVEGDNSMPEICRFFGIIIRMYFDEHNPPHFHTEFGGNKAVFDLLGNITRGDLKSRTAVKLIREWIDLHKKELEEDWNLSRSGKPLKEIAPLD